MKIYNYNESGVFISEQEARIDPLEGNYLIPRNSTTVEPPSPSGGEALLFSNGKWSSVPDFRGYIGYDPDGGEHSISEVGITPDPQWSTTPPPVTSLQISSLEFFDRFTEEEQVAIATETYTNIQVKIFYDRMFGANHIDVSNANTISGIDYLISLNLVDASRKDDLLAAEAVS